MSEQWTPEKFQLAKEERDANGHMQWAVDEMRKGLTIFMKALREVHAKRSYRFKYPSFEDFCEKELQISRQRGLQLVNAENLRVILESNLPPASPVTPEVIKALPETHLRELAKTTPEQAIEILASEPKVTAKRIRERINPDKVKPQKRCPHCGEPI